MRQLQVFICGFSPAFTFVILSILLLFIWPHPLDTFLSGKYRVEDTEAVTIFAAVLCGTLVGMTFVLFDSMLNPPRRRR